MVLNKPFESIGESDLISLIDNEIMEGRDVDYKEILDITGDAKKEFLADISSFANTSGGHLIIGIEEEKGIPTKLKGLEINDIDAEKLRLDQIIQSGIRPRMVPSHQIQPVTLEATKRTVFVIRIHKSLTLPHMVSYKESNKFYARNSGGKYLVDVGEIKNLFLLSEGRIERIKNFRAERLAKILGEDTPIELKKFPRIILHLVPLAISEPTSIYDISEFYNRELQTLFPLNQTRKRYNFDGILAYDTVDSGQSVYAYTQLFHNGSIEAIDTYFLHDRDGRDKVIRNKRFETDLVSSLKHYLFVQKRIGVTSPIFAMLSMIGVKDYSMLTTSKEGILYTTEVIDRDNLIVPEVFIDSFNVNHAKVMKPIFDSVWNACGMKGSSNYDDDEKWKLED